MPHVGALVTLELPVDSPVRNMPWIITFGPLSDDEEWEPVVCGPYERPHALSIAESVVADQELMAVVEPLLPHVDTDQIRGEIEAAKIMADAREEPGGDLLDESRDNGRHEHREPGEPPSPAEVRAGMARIAAKLTS
jgi:hypothetical protein